MQPSRVGHACSSRRSGFTLIELLVVISIIALLIAILLPALSGARAVAQSSQCLSNLRSHMIAFHVYASDHNGVLPAAAPQVRSDINQTAAQWHTSNVPATMNGMAPLFMGPGSPASTPGSTYLWLHHIYPYAPAREAYLCPSTESTSNHSQDPDNDEVDQTGFANINYGMGTTGGIRTNALLPDKWAKIDSIRGHSTRAITGDSILYHKMNELGNNLNLTSNSVGSPIPGWGTARGLLYTATSGSAKDANFGRHVGLTFNTSWLDGHAENIAARDVYENLLEPGGTFANMINNMTHKLHDRNPR